MKLTKWDAEERVVIKQVKGVSKVTFEVYARLPNGKVVRQRYNDETKALAGAEDLKIQGLNLLKAKNQNIRPSSIDSTQEGDYRTALDIVAKVKGAEDWSVTKVATWFAANFKEQDWTDTLVVDAVRDFIAWKKREGAKKNYLDKIGWRLGITTLKDGTERIKEGSFASIDRFLNDITVEELDDRIWSEAWDVSNSTRRDLWKTLSTFYDWASEKKPRRCDRNPIKQIAKPPANELDPEAFTVDQAKAIIETAAKCFDGELVPYFAIALFGGLRPQEIQGNDTLKPLTWNPDNIVWDKDDEGNDKVSIRLRGKQAWRRTVLLPDNCVAWIKPYKKDEGPVCPGNFLKKFDVIRCAAGFRVGKGRIHGIDKKGIDGLDDPYSTDRPEWIQDGCRHSALSYRLAIVEDVNAVCSWAGNSPRTFKGNYEALVTKEQAKKYWAIYP